MKRNMNIRLWMVALLAVAIGLLALPAARAAGPLATVNVSAVGLDWQPSGTYEKMTLTVSGPGGLILRSEFRAGTAPSLDLFGKDGKPLPDGAYRYELTAAPVLDQATRDALAAARKAGDDDAIARLQASGKLPSGALSMSGVFAVAGGTIVRPDLVEERKSQAAAQAKAGERTLTVKDQVIPDDLIVQGSACVGLDCVNNESFGFDTIRLKENNTRIKFDDTSVGTFPANDWQLTANDSASGGASKFSIEDITGSKVPFTITAGAATNSIFADSTGRIGLRTSTPVLDLHINTSNTPAIRMEQNNSGGFTAQTWDIAGNEANFFVRDVTSGSRLPFRIRPGAPTSSIDISADGDVGVGTASPSNKLDVRVDGSGIAVARFVNTNAGGFSGFEFYDSDGTTQGTFFGTDNTNNQTRINSLNNFPLVIFTNSTERIRFPAPGGNVITAANGAFLSSGGTWTNASSRSFKKDITDLDAGEALATIKKLDPVTFQYNSEPGEKYVGFIAEDVPELVAMNDHKSLSPMDVVAVLTKVVQEQQKTIEALAAKVDELEKANKN